MKHKFKSPKSHVVDIFANPKHQKKFHIDSKKDLCVFSHALNLPIVRKSTGMDFKALPTIYLNFKKH